MRYLPWQIQHQGQWQTVKVTGGKQQGNQLIVKLDGCDTPELAKTYANNPIAILREQLPPLPLGEYYWTDLIGLQVINQDGVDFGQVDSLLETGSNDVLVVKGDRQRLIPYTNTAIQGIDLAKKTITVVWDADF